MRRFAIFGFALAAVLALAPGMVEAQTIKLAPTKPKRPTPTPTPAPAPVPAVRAPSPAVSQPPRVEPRRTNIVVYPYGLGPGGGYPFYPGYGYPYGTGYGYDYPYGYSGYPYGYGYGVPLYPGPAFVNPNLLYGPRPIQEMMGVGRWFDPKPVAAAPRVAARPAPVAADERPARAVPQRPARAKAEKPDKADKPDKDEAANGEGSPFLAEKFIEFGDSQFTAKKYTGALDRYRKAVKAAPQMGLTYFRQGIAQAALNQYDAAASSFKRGLEFQPQWATSGFKLSSLFRDEDAKTRVLEAIAGAVEADPRNSDLAFVAGVLYHFDGQRDRSQAFFQRAAAMTHGEKDHIKAFLGP